MNRTIGSVRQHYKNPTQRVGLVQSGHYHFIEYNFFSPRYTRKTAHSRSIPKKVIANQYTKSLYWFYRSNFQLTANRQLMVLCFLTVCFQFTYSTNSTNDIIVPERPNLSWSRNATSLQMGESRSSMHPLSHPQQPIIKCEDTKGVFRSQYNGQQKIDKMTNTDL